MPGDASQIVRVEPEEWLATLGDALDAGLAMFDFLTAVDWPDRDQVEVVVHVLAPRVGRLEPPETQLGTRPQERGSHGAEQGEPGLNGSRLRGRRVHTMLSRQDLRLQSLTGLFRGALWHERETHEMFGVNFSGHPGLRPLLRGGPGTPPLLRTTPLAARLAVRWPGLADPADNPPPGVTRSPRPGSRAVPKVPGVHVQWEA